MIVPIYISELAPPAVRGRLVGIYELGWQIGGLVGFWWVSNDEHSS
jgi:MFS family permease